MGAGVAAVLVEAVLPTLGAALAFRGLDAFGTFFATCCSSWPKRKHMMRSRESATAAPRSFTASAWRSDAASRPAFPRGGAARDQNELRDRPLGEGSLLRLGRRTRSDVEDVAGKTRHGADDELRDHLALLVVEIGERRDRAEIVGELHGDDAHLARQR